MTTISMPPQQKDEDTPLLPTTTPTTHPTPTKKPWSGRGWLLLVALLYGTLNVTLRGVYAQPHPPSAAALSASRGWLAVFCFLPLWWWWKRRCRSSPSSTTTTTHSSLAFQKQAFELAVWNFGAQGLANIGLRTVPSARAAFLTQTSVVWTPLLSLVLVHPSVKPPQRRQWWASLVCVCGLCVLSWSSSSTTSTSSSNTTETVSSSSYHQAHHGMTPGHVLLLLAAGCWSMYIIRLSLFSSSSSNDEENEIPLQAYKNVYLASLYSVWWCLQSWTTATRHPPPPDDQDQDSSSSSSAWYHDTHVWLLLIYSAVGPGTLADLWQQQGQRLLPNATESNVWLSLEPVFTALLGVWCLHEPLAWHDMCGGALVVCAALWSATSSTGE